MNIDNLTLKRLRDILAVKLDSEIFKPDLFVLVELVFFLALYWTCFYLAAKNLTLGFILFVPMGILLQILANVNHEMLHGNVLKSPFWMYLFAIPVMFLNTISPHYWVHTHHSHHRMLDIWRYKQKAKGEKTVGTKKRFIAKKLFFIDYFFLGTTKFRFRHIQFLFEKGMKNIFSDKNVFLIFLETTAIIIFKIVIAYYLGIKAWFIIEFLPFIIYSFISGCYFATSHSRSLGNNERTNINIYTVRTSPFIDGLFYYLGYHIEHHLFPSVPKKHLPLIATFLEEEGLYQSHKYNHLEAIIKSYRYNRERL